MRRQTILAAASGLALVLGAGSALAQDPTPLAPGATIEGAIEGGDLTAAENSYRYDEYAISARAGQRFEAVLRSVRLRV